MKKILILILFSFAVFSCFQKEKIKKVTNENETSKENETVIHNHEEIENEQSIENQELLTQLESELNTFRNNQKFSITKELINNRHVDNQIDTAVTYTADKVIIETYKISDNEEWIIQAKIINTELAFSKLVKIGMEVKAMEKMTNTKIKSDVMRIGNMEETSAFVFKFKDNKVYEINYEGYVD
jgi:hypothetical protein